MSVRRSILHCFRRAIIAVSVMAIGAIIHSEAFAQIPANLGAMTPDQLAAEAAKIPVDQFSALIISRSTPEQMQQWKLLMGTPQGKEFLDKLPPEHAEALKKAVEQKIASAPAIPPLPKGKPVKIYIQLFNKMVIEAVSAEQEKAKRAQFDEQVKLNAGPYFRDGKYLPSLMEFVLIPAGSFFMGSNVSESGRLSDELRHEVQISKPFWMSCFEVTQEQWIAIMGKSASNVVSLPPSKDVMEVPTLIRGAGYPMYNITHEEAMTFCKRLTEIYRKAAQSQDPKKYFRLPENMEFSLPTEAQWEYACRAGSLTPFSSGEILLARDANYNVVRIKRQIVETSKENNQNDWGGPDGERQQQTKKPKIRTVESPYTPVLRPVGVGNPNDWGLYDMHGSVWEWVKGCYYPYTQGKAVDPQGFRSGTPNVARGGSWYSLARDCRSARRLDIDGKTRQNNIGFRVVIVEK